MGRTPKPLTILCLGVWDDSFVSLIDQGHVIDKDEPTRPLAEYDMIFGPYCWMLDDQHMKYLPLAIAEARRRRYPKEKE